VKSPEYLEWVRKQPSCVTGDGGCEAHHIIGHGRLSTSKTSDVWAIPLTPRQHRHLHEIGWKQWEQLNGDQAMYALQTILRAVESGVLVVVAKPQRPIAYRIATKPKTKIGLRSKKPEARTSSTASPSRMLRRKP
jgi:antitoxin (DNA-binding transcriptional repressor) of toxin-antitoxin stability system